MEDDFHSSLFMGGQWFVLGEHFIYPPESKLLHLRRGGLGERHKGGVPDQCDKNCN
jgi:hypothetical protein